jgi:ABC-type multidrug transport system fused ATPase/permease subunit
MYSLRLLSFLRPYKARAALLAFCVIASSAAVLAIPQLIRWAIDYGIGIDDLNDEPTGKNKYLIIAAVALIGAAALRGIFAFGQTYLSEWIGQRVAYDIRNRIYDRLQRLSFAYHDQQQTGNIMSRATQDVEAVRWYISMGVLRGSYVFLVMFVVLLLMLVTSWQLALVAWAFVPLIVWRSSVMAFTLRPLWMQIQEGLGKLGATLQEALTGARVVKAFAREDYEGEKFEAQAQELFDYSYVSSRVQAINGPLMTGIWMAAIAVTLWFGGRQVANGDMNIGELAAFLLYLTILQQPVRVLGWITMVISRANAAGQRIYEIIDAESAVQEKSDAKVLTNPQGHVTFEGVSFGYDSVAAVLKDIDIDARPGQVVALMGPTGSGKSTVVNLMPRFYDVTGGAITIDGTDIRDLTIESLRGAIGVVQQDVFLFSDTIRNNIAYGAVDATDEAIEEAAKAAYIHDFIKSMPDGYDTWVGERGITLSGGQKQRIAIARTLLLDPKILILDDSTSSVDTETEYQIQQTLQELMKGRTTFVIAQRLRTVKMADQILVLQDGEIVERGRHEELLERDGIYRQIYDLELRDQEEALAGRGPTAPQVRAPEGLPTGQAGVAGS